MNEHYPIVIANLKANLIWNQVSQWIDKVGPKASKFKGTIILCPSAPFLAASFQKIHEKSFNIKLGSQDISIHSMGAYTGEFVASQIEDLVGYSIVGHSERRKYFNETDENVIAKIRFLISSNIIPVLCVSDLRQLESYLKKGSQIIENLKKIIFVYEPPTAISGGGEYKPEKPEVANKNALEISQKLGQKVTTIYGGSINPENARKFFSQANLDGGLIGQASVNPETFLQILESVSLQYA